MEGKLALVNLYSQRNDQFIDETDEIKGRKIEIRWLVDEID